MRLICPNCDAQYEVPDDIMPSSGRDVQCSNCGQTWFQHHPDHMPDDEADTPQPPSPDEETTPPPPPPPPPRVAQPERKQLDPAVADILRQEAEAEQAARRKMHPSGLESQPDLGLDLEDQRPEDDADQRAREARDRMARLRGNDAPKEKTARPPAAAALGSRRDLLPDIEEINSSLRADTVRSGAATADIAPEFEAPTRQRMRRGFRTGFLTVLMVFIVLGVVYIMAPRLALAVPAFETPITAYVTLVNQGRSWLDGALQGVLGTLDSVAQDSDS
jgi:predicted Zn finger-like uncharacterized protein